MVDSQALTQRPRPGQHLVRFRGDTLTFELKVPAGAKGRAWLRTNLGQAAVGRREIIRSVHFQDPPLNTDWWDIPMRPAAAQTFRLTVPLAEVGHFEAKCFFLGSEEKEPLWPPGPNTAINVDAAFCCCANTVYNAFVRQFGPNKAKRIDSGPEKQWSQALEEGGYAVIPPSGTFRDLIAELDFIVYGLGCRILQLLPIHPTPTTYGRMGRFGSPYAALSFTAVDPALAVFDPRATPLEQFIELADAVHQRQAGLFIDMALNHTGWAARLHETHPEWLVRDPQGRISVPGAWGVRWEDLTQLDYHHRGLWRSMAECLLTWCHRGVDGFRCDAGYMIPAEAWRYMVAMVRERFPDTVFILEGLGGKISVTRSLLNSSNLNWGYSELFQNYDRRQIEAYFPESTEISESDGLLIHFAETHDNDRLAARSERYARMRTELCALFSHLGAFGFANGVEWFATEKIDVHDANSLNWGAPNNQVERIRRLNTLLKIHPAFFPDTRLKMVQAGPGNQVVLLRDPSTAGKKLLIAVNLDDAQAQRGTWDPDAAGMAVDPTTDLLSGKKVAVSRADGLVRVELAPAQVLCLAEDPQDLALLEASLKRKITVPPRLHLQNYRAKVLEVLRLRRGKDDLQFLDIEGAVERLAADPAAFCEESGPGAEQPAAVIWRWPADLRRQIMLPPMHFLLVYAPAPFRARLLDGGLVFAQEESLEAADGSHFALFSPRQAAPAAHRPIDLSLSLYLAEGCRRAEAPLLQLANWEALRMPLRFGHQPAIKRPLCFLGTNGRGAMLRAQVNWGKLDSRYDALLAGNLNPDFPEDRWIMFTRCRAWVVFQGFSRELSADSLALFHWDGPQRGFWRFSLPAGQGESIRLTVGMEMVAGHNAMRILFFRHRSSAGSGRLEDRQPIALILRPDIEDRNFHHTTKAYLGPENRFREAVVAEGSGFIFSPTPQRRLRIQTDRGTFFHEPEWYYMVHRPQEALRGLDPDSDLFSPGYITAQLQGGQTLELTASIHSAEPSSDLPPGGLRNEIASIAQQKPKSLPLEQVLTRVLDQYVVARAGLATVIAGYPWFLDWGRDTLIVLRGLIAAGKLDTARGILRQFARFEDRGTLPNMIHGEDAGNRDTSDAPLWFFVACAEFMRAEGSKALLAASCGHRQLKEVLLSMGSWLSSGTPNGIHMDPQTGLLFSPAHFTWMDTNYPAGSPREGYPVEIQALWFAAVSLLQTVDSATGRRRWRRLAARIRQNLLDLYGLSEQGFMADCLHARAGQTALQAVADDHLRPNQLLTVTLGAVVDESVRKKVLRACQELLVPGAIRSLADRRVRHPLPVLHNGALLNDPQHPYAGRYAGDEDTQRKPAYHNGTAWSWLFPSFCEAWFLTYGRQSRQTALAWLGSGYERLRGECIGHVPEILDGDYPHQSRGCDAQAWGTSEMLRVWHLLKS